ncbi:unnamed protein product [Penicillium roqueforti FM164]|uniref:Uncharacterized protein n=1 Tax=Penicillium roqueforti (strain FM164) TaxID=1365484 RepID=W6QR10_PENRF|nr:unnamed protein product [Penicillium roqueforti FM164]
MHHTTPHGDISYFRVLFCTTSSISTYDDRVLVPGTTERCCTPPEGAQTLPHGAQGNEGAQNLPHGAHGSEGGQEACSYSPKWARRAFLSVPTTRLDKYH